MNPTFQNTNIGGRKPKFDSEKTIKNAEEITQNLLLLSTFSGILSWLSMISRFLCFSKAYLCRGQSSPKRRWIVVASWRQLWRRPWRRRFGIVKRTLCVRVCVCVCVLYNAIKSEAPWHGIRRFLFFFVSTSFSKKVQESHRAPHVLSPSLSFFFFFSLSFFLQCLPKSSLSSLSLSFQLSLSLVLVCCRSPTTERTRTRTRTRTTT